MTIAYFDCFSGVSGDMVLGALVDAGLDFDRLRKELRKLPVDNFRIQRRYAKKHEIVATKIDVIVKAPDGRDVVEAPGADEPHHHYDHNHGPARHLKDLLEIINESDLDPAIRKRASSVFEHLAAAEGTIHGMDKEDIHLHEVSGMDAVIDIVGACVGLYQMGIEEVYVSALPIGSGFVRCAHGRLPVPAPGALELLKGVPVYQTGTRGELVTPTGAAIVKTIATGFGPMPRMDLNLIGYGAGTKDFEEHPNLLRVCIGER